MNEELISLEDAVVDALQIHARLPVIILGYVTYHYPSKITIEDIKATLQQLETDDKVRRYVMQSGQITTIPISWSDRSGLESNQPYLSIYYLNNIY